jgi:hypothetical protein
MKQYLTMSNTNLVTLDAEVNTKLKEGWELYGSPYGVAGYNSRYIHFYQALVRDRKTKSDTEVSETEESTVD